MPRRLCTHVPKPTNTLTRMPTGAFTASQAWQVRWQEAAAPALGTATRRTTLAHGASPSPPEAWPCPYSRPAAARMRSPAPRARAESGLHPAGAALVGAQVHAPPTQLRWVSLLSYLERTSGPQLCWIPPISTATRLAPRSGPAVGMRRRTQRHQQCRTSVATVKPLLTLRMRLRSTHLRLLQGMHGRHDTLRLLLRLMLLWATQARECLDHN